MQNNKYKGKCKYCHLEGHVIDKCPTIICKYCKAVGHPNWLCKSNPNAENKSNENKSVENKSVENKSNESKSVKNLESPNLRNKKSVYGFESTNSSNSLGSMKENKKDYSNFRNDFMKKNEETNDTLLVSIPEIVYNLKYYESMINKKWGDIINL
jgi:hypothetical protein